MPVNPKQLGTAWGPQASPVSVPDRRAAPRAACPPGTRRCPSAPHAAHRGKDRRRVTTSTRSTYMYDDSCIPRAPRAPLPTAMDASLWPCRSAAAWPWTRSRSLWEPCRRPISQRTPALDMVISRKNFQAVPLLQDVLISSGGASLSLSCR